MTPHIRRLISGGIMTTYQCTSKCRHCLYRSSPKWPADYISDDRVDDICRKILDLSCRNIHIGGGEPFIHPDRLVEVARRIRDNGISIEYIETNSSWYKDADQAAAILDRLLAAGVGTLLVSISPFHNEYVPFKKISGVIAVCRQRGMQVFPWVQGFIDDLKRLDPDRPHRFSEYMEVFGENYLQEIPSRYWINFRGRAVDLFRPVFGVTPLKKILNQNRGSCTELLETGHFHFDPYGNYIPGLCTGLSIHYSDLGRPLDQEKYPFLTLLCEEGINGLAERAIDRYGFTPRDGYLSKCDLCHDIRKFFVLKKGVTSNDLKPFYYYEAD